MVTWARLIWSLCSWWCWLGILMMLVSAIGGLAWFWLDLTWSGFKGHGFELVLTLAVVGGILTTIGMQRPPLPLRVLVHLPPEASPPPTKNRVGVLRWLRNKYRRHKKMFGP